MGVAMHQQIETFGWSSAENEARLAGLVAVLGLPPVRGLDGKERRRVVEVEIADDLWQVIDGMAIDADGVTFFTGHNGTRSDWRFRRTEGFPRWRLDHGRPRRVVFIVGDS